MEKKQFTSLRVSDGSIIDVWVTWPDEMNKYPAVLLFDEGYGINAHIRSVAERISREGYVVLVPDLYHRLGRRLQVPYGDNVSVLSLAGSISIKELTIDLKAMLSALESLPYVDRRNIGALGFSHGGKYAMIANSLFSLLAGVSFYGIGLDNFTNANFGHGSPQLFFWGARDADNPPSRIARLEKGLSEAGKDFTSVIISYAGSGFFCDERSSYHPLAARQAWGHTLSFFDYLLK